LDLENEPFYTIFFACVHFMMFSPVQWQLHEDEGIRGIAAACPAAQVQAKPAFPKLAA
jgi:hypothetical protein